MKAKFSEKEIYFGEKTKKLLKMAAAYISAYNKGISKTKNPDNQVINRV